MRDMYPDMFRVAELAIKHRGLDFFIRLPEGGRRHAGDARRLALGQSALASINRSRTPDLGEITSMAATWRPPKGQADSLITIGCKHIPPVPVNHKGKIPIPTMVEREYTLNRDADHNAIVDLPLDPPNPHEHSIGTAVPIEAADKTFIGVMLISIGLHYPPRPAN